MSEIIIIENSKDVSNNIQKLIYYEVIPFPFNNKIYYNKSNYIFIYNNLLFKNYYSPSFFVEGIDNKDIHLNIEMIDGQDIGYITGQIITNNFISIENIPIEKYKIYTQDTTWFKIIEKNQTMIKGELNGNINIKDCGTSNSYLVVKCFRFEDNHFIGEYPIVNGVYNIPNLDVNTYYNLILEDKNRIIEQQVLSYRKPTAY